MLSAGVEGPFTKVHPKDQERPSLGSTGNPTGHLSSAQNTCPPHTQRSPRAPPLSSAGVPAPLTFLVKDTDERIWDTKKGYLSLGSRKMGPKCFFWSSQRQGCGGRSSCLLLGTLSGRVSVLLLLARVLRGERNRLPQPQNPCPPGGTLTGRGRGREKRRERREEKRKGEGEGRERRRKREEGKQGKRGKRREWREEEGTKRSSLFTCAPHPFPLLWSVPNPGVQDPWEE